MNDQTGRNKTLVIIIAILLIANIATMTLFLLNRNGHGNERNDRKNSMRTFLQKDLHFSDVQLTSFDTLKEQHRRSVKPLFDSIRSQKVLVLKNLGNSHFADSLLENAATSAAANQKTLELSLLKHIAEIRSICTPAQLPAFDSGFYKIMSRPPGDDKKKEK